MSDQHERLEGSWSEGARRAGAAYARRRISIDPVTRLEGHGKIDIFLDQAGEVERAYFQVPELRGFEKFVQGRPAEEMPQITSRICGVCPTAHHMAATKALDHLYRVEPTPTAKKIRELVYSAFMAEDHALHFYFLGGPDFVVGPTAPAAERNVLGVIGVVGAEVGKQVIAMRRRLRERSASRSSRCAGACARRSSPRSAARSSIRFSACPAGWPSTSLRSCRIRSGRWPTRRSSSGSSPCRSSATSC
jgi:hypothetical protein